MAITRSSGDAGKGEVPKPDEHSHKDGASCSVCAHGDVDPHAWLDPIAAIALVNTLADRLIALRPLSNASSPNAGDSPAKGLHPIRVQADALIGQLDQLHREFAAQTGVLKDVPLIVAHDAYRWLARRYDLTFVPIAGLTASEPKPAQLKRAIESARQSRARVIFVEPQTNPQAAKRVAESVGARLVTLDPLGSGSYVQMMRANLSAMLQAAADGSLREPRSGQGEAKSESAS
jgi:zinc transport system substrate-binding protein